MKRLATLILTLLVLLGGYFLLKWYFQPEEFVQPVVFNFSEVTEDKIDRIKLVFADESQIELNKDGETWKVNTHLADENRLNEIFIAFESAKITSRVSSNKQNHSRFEVDEKAIKLSFFNSGDSILEFLMGKSAGGSSVYVRMADDDDVYVLEGLATHNFTNELSLWRNRNIVTSNKDSVRLVRYEKNGQTIQISQTGENWLLQLGSLTPIQVDSQKTVSWINSVVSLQASDFPEEDVTPVLNLVNVKIETGTEESFSGGENLVISTVNKENQVHLVNGGLSYYIIESTIDSVFPSYNELLERVKSEEAPTETK